MPHEPGHNNFWAQYDTPNASRRNDVFADAINRYLDAQYPLPRETSPVRGIPRFLGDAVAKYFGMGSGMPGKSLVYPALAANELLSSLLGIDSPLQQAVPEGAIDITDPSVVPGSDTQFAPLERFIRDIRMVSRATGETLFRGASLPAGLQLGYLEGSIAPPKDGREQILQTLGALIAGAVPFVGAGALAGPTANVLRGGAVMPGALGATARAPLTEIVSTKMLGELGIDASIGAAFGAGEAVAEGQIAKLTGDEAPNVREYAEEYGLWGLGLGALFRIPTSANAVRFYKGAGRTLGIGQPKLDVAPGLVHDGVKTELRSGKVVFRDATTGKYMSVDEVGAERIQNFRQQSAAKAQQLASGTPAGQLVQEQMATPDAFPPDMSSPEALNMINRYAGAYYNRAKQLIGRWGPEKAQRQAIELRKFMFSDEPINARLAAAGKVQAFQHALGEGQRIPGQLPVELEANAIEVVNRALPRGRAEVERLATDAVLDGREAFGRRMLELLDSPELNFYNEAHARAMAKANTKSHRGFKEGSKAMYQGRPVQLMQRPKFGLAQAKYLDKPEPKPVLVDVADLQPIPKVGQTAYLKDKRIAHIKIVDEAQGRALTQIHGQENAEWVPFDQIDELASSRSTLKSQEAVSKALDAELDTSDIQPIPPTPVATSTGEVATATAAGENAVVVKTKSGRKKTVKRSEVQPINDVDAEAQVGTINQRITNDLDAVAAAEASQKGQAIAGAFDTEAEALALANSLKGPRSVGKVQDRYYVMVPDEEGVAAAVVPSAPPGDRTIGTFTPGKIPEPGNRILFFRVLNEGKGAMHEDFRSAWKSGKRTIGNYIREWSKRGTGKYVVQAHVLPQPGTGDDVLYAIEIPAAALPKKNYSAMANEAIAALGGKGTIKMHISWVDVPEEVFNNSRIYEVPEPLRNATVRPDAILKEMSPAEQTNYLRNLLVANENIPSEVAQPIAKAKQARKEIALGAAKGDGETVLNAENQLVESHVEAAEALETVRVENAKVSSRRIIDDVRLTDEEAPAREAFELEGLTPETQGYYNSKLEALPTAMAGDLNKDAMVAHSINIKGQRAFISRYQRPHFVEGKQGATPEAYPYYVVEIVDPEGMTLPELSRQFDTPEQVGAFLQREGYEPTLYHTLSGEYHKADDHSLVVTIRPLAKGTKSEAEVVMMERQGPKGERLNAPQMDELDRELMLDFSEGHTEVASGQPMWKPVASKKVKNAIEADEHLRKNGFVRKEPVPDLTEQFKKLPSIDQLNRIVSGEETFTAPPKLVRRSSPFTAEQLEQRKKLIAEIQKRVDAGEITKEEGAYEVIEWGRQNRGVEVARVERKAEVAPYMRKIESDLQDIMDRFVRTQQRVPNAVRAYANDFAKLYYETIGSAPWNKHIRTRYLGDLGIPHVDDYGPSGMSSALETGVTATDDGSVIDTGVSIQKGILPDDITVSVSIGKNIHTAAETAQKLAKVLAENPSPGLEQTKMGILVELNDVAKTLKTSGKAPEVEAAMARLHLLRRKVVAFKKLEMGIRPTSTAPVGAAESQAGRVRRAERAAARGRVAASAEEKQRLAAAVEKVKTVKPYLSEMDLLPANEEVMKRIASLDDALRPIMEGPHGQESRTILPHDFEADSHIFYPHVLGISTKGKSELLQEAKRIVQARKQQTIWAEAAAKNEKILPEPSQFSVRDDINTARYKPTGQLVEVMDDTENLLLGDEVNVRFMDGQEMKVNKADLKLTTGKKGQDGLDYRMAEYILEGRFASTFKREPPIGLGVLERRLGLMGSNNRRVIAGAAYGRAQELLNAVDPKAPIGAQEVWHELFEMWQRGKWLDKVETPPRGPLVTTKTVEKTPVVEKTQPRSLLGSATGGLTPAVGVRHEGPVEFAGGTEFVPGSAQGSAYLKGRARQGPPVVTESVSDAVLEAIKEKDPKLVKPFKWAAYQHARRVLGDDPFAELQAQAMAGYLSEKQASALREFAVDNGISASLPLEQLVVELRERQLLDPHTAMWSVKAKKFASIQKWAEEVTGGNALYSGFPLGGLGGKRLPEIIIKPVASVKDLKFGGILGSTWRIAQKHPLSRYISDLLYRAQEKEKTAIIRRMREFLTSLDQMGLKWVDRKAIRRMTMDANINGWRMWDDIAANSEIYKGLGKEQQQLYQRGYFMYRKFMADRLQDLKRHFLRRRVKPIIYDPTNQEHRDFAYMLSKEYGVSVEDLQAGTALMPFTPELIYRNGQFAGYGLAPRGYTEDEISFFLRLQEQYGSEAELPAMAPPGIRPEIYDEFREVFDFWQRYGQENYWPLVHEGSIAAINAENKVIAWGQTIPDVIEHLRTMRKDGRLTEADRITIKQSGRIADDIIISATKTAKEWRQLDDFFAQQLHLDPDEVMAIITRAERPRMEMKKPGQVHGKPRKAGLEPVEIDPDVDLGLLNARIARMDYRWDVLNAWRSFNDVGLDNALSSAYGAPKLHGEMPELKNYMIDVFSTAVGERRQAEKVADVFWAAIHMMREAPKQSMAVMRGEIDLLTALDYKTYFRPYAARARASDLLGAQTLVKLGFSAGSAFANYFQFFATTMPKLIQPGESPASVAKLMWNSQKNAFKIFRARYPLFGQPTELTGDLRMLAEMLDESGIDLLPAKQQAGGRSVGDILGGPPIPGESKLQYAKDWLDYKALYLFNGAEKMNRFSTTLAGLEQYANRLGKPISKLTSVQRREAIEYARRLVRETQFLYDELSLPRILRSGPLAGPFGRILFQFKPFMLNMMEYEASLIKNAFLSPETRFGGIAMGQLAAHFGAMAAAGGAVGLLYNPVVSIPYQLFTWITGERKEPAHMLEAYQRERRRDSMSPEEQFQQSWKVRADDVLMYGLPGLIGLDLGQRVGVSGQDLMMTLDVPGVLGPHASAYYDIAKAWQKHMGSRGHGRAVAGAAAGAVAATFLPKEFQKQVPWLTTYASTAGAMLASRGTPNDFREFITKTPEGARMAARLQATIVKNAIKTFELFSDGAVRDMDGKPAFVPADDRFGEAAWLALGLPSTRREEYSAALNMLAGQAAVINNTRQILTTRAAQAWAEGDYGKFYEIMAGAAELDIDLDHRSIERELESITQERMSTIFQRLPTPMKVK